MIVRALHLVVFALAGRGDRELFRAVLRLAPSVVVSGVLLLAAGSLRGTAKYACWGAAALISYMGPLIGHMRGWRLSPDHFVERFGQIVLIALGESVVAIGVGVAGLDLGPRLITAVVLGITVVACMWWAYFDWVVYVAKRRLIETSGARRAVLARDVYSYLHLPMVGGIVLFAFGLQSALHDTSDSLSIVPAFGLVVGIAIYFLAHVVLRLRIGGGLGRGRPAAALALLAALPVATHVDADIALATATGICVAVIAYEVIMHRDDRAAVRAERGAQPR
jgi:low temperature requirement protein LtrA